ncbi:hypothetical protein FJY63_13965 [Candidatus Sumerlaeota bacterium]|nr:hypothetical protein [Candidatus Sumerlaeota bacterium]
METNKRRRSRKQMLPRVAEIVLFLFAAFCIVILVTQDFHLVTSFLFSPFALFLLVVIFVEYLMIKSGDRSRLYLIELERMRKRDQEHIAMTRRALEEIERCLPQTGDPSVSTGESSPQSADDKTRECLQRVENILRSGGKE